MRTRARMEGRALWGTAGFCRRGPSVRGHRLEETQDRGPGRFSTCVTTLGGPEMTPGWTRGSFRVSWKMSQRRGRESAPGGGKAGGERLDVLMSEETVRLEVAPCGSYRVFFLDGRGNQSY